MRVLMVAHGWPPAASGGAELHSRSLARGLVSLGDEITVLAREDDPSRPEFEVRRENDGPIRVVRVNNGFRNVRQFETSYRNPVIREIGRQLVEEVRPDVIHIQHLTGLSTDLIEAFAGRGAPIFLTLHDYWLFCQRGQLLDLDGARCEGPSPTGCARCMGLAAGSPAMVHAGARLLRSAEGALPRAGVRALRRLATVAAEPFVDSTAALLQIEARLAHIRAMCSHVTRFLSPSRTVRDRFASFGIDPARIELLELGVDPEPYRGLSRVSGDRLRLAFLGSMMLSKGPHVALEAFAQLPAGRASLAVHGAFAAYHGDDRYRDVLAPLLRTPGILHTGPLPHDRVPGALAAIDALVVPSVWAENSPSVVREAFLAGVPVVASDVGGLAEQIQDGVNGLLFRPGDAADLARALRRLLDEPDLLPHLRAGIPRVRSLAEEARWTRALYQTHAAGPVVAARPRLAAVVLNYRTPEKTISAVRSLQASERPVDDLLVVDNGSADGSEEAIRKALPGTTVLQTRSNLGFSGGCNAGIRAALERGADLVLLANSDVVFPRDSLGRLEEVLLSTPGAGVAGPVVLSSTERDLVDSAGISFDPETGRMRLIGAQARHAGLAPFDRRTVDAVSGCAMLIRRETLAAIGLLADEYFFSFEDLEFCLRARALGFSTVCAGGATVFHEGGASIGAASPRRVYFASRNHLLLASRMAPRSAFREWTRAARIVLLNAAYALRGGARLANLSAVFRGTRDHRRRRYGSGGAS